MNKLFTKIASLTLGLALAAGAGAFLGSRAAEGVNATETVFSACDFTAKTANSNSYYSVIEYGDYSVYGGANNNGGWEYYKFGPKKSKAADPTKVTDNYVRSPQLNEKITKIGIQILASTVGSEGIVTWGAGIYSDSEYSTQVDTVSLSTLKHKTAGTYYLTPSSGDYWDSGNYYQVNIHVENTTTTNGVVWVEKVVFYYESSVKRGEASIDGLDSNLLFVGDSKSLVAGWDPLDSGATVSSYSFTSSDTDVLTFSGDTYTAVAPGKAKVTLNLTDSNSQEYVVTTGTIFVSNEYGFEVGDNVALYSSGTSMELSSIYHETGKTHYGVGTAYVTKPNGTYLLAVEDGSVSGSLSFVNDGNYLSWSSGNSLTISTTKNENSSWYVVSYDDYDLLVNAATTTREVWWNNTSGSERFACYEGKTPSSSGYNATSLMKIEEAPVRGTIAIDNSFGNSTRQGSKGNLSYTWTPAEGSGATIVSYAWASTNSDVMSVSGDLYEAIGPGKAKITLSATDSNGQEYSATTSDINIVEVVSGSYVLYTSVSDGDTIAIACNSYGTQFSGLTTDSNKYGKYVFYDPSPASIYDFTLEANGDYFALKNSEDKYLSWKSEAYLQFVDEATSDNALWSITFDENDAIISNKALDGEGHRYLAWNNGSPRFAAYKSGQTPIQLYGPSQEIVISENGLAFINNLLSYTCDDQGQTAPSTSAWSSLNTQYDATGDDTIPTEDKDLFKGITAVEHASPVTTREKVEQAMAKYDYIVGKYNKTLGLTEDYPDFINRDPAPLRNISAPTLGTNSSNTAIIVVTVIAVVSVSSIGVLLVLKRRKNHI